MAPCRIIHEIIALLGSNHTARVNTVGGKPRKRNQDNRLKPLTHCISGHRFTHSMSSELHSSFTKLYSVPCPIQNHQNRRFEIQYSPHFLVVLMRLQGTGRIPSGICGLHGYLFSSTQPALARAGRQHLCKCDRV